MAEYYNSRSSIDGNTKGSFGAKFQRWDMVHSGSKGGAGGWSNSNFPSKGERHSDHVYSPGVLGSMEEPPKVRESIHSTVQNAACTERRVGFPEGPFLHHLDNRNGYSSNYENINDAKPNGWKKPGNGYVSSRSIQEHPGLIPGTGWPSQPSYSSRYGAAPLGRATDDIGTTVSYMKGSACPPVTMPEMNRWSRGADAVLGNTSSSGIMPTIDSREAAKKYNGYFI